MILRVCSLQFFNAVKTFLQILQMGPVEEGLTFINFYAEEKALNLQVKSYTDPVKRENLFAN